MHSENPPAAINSSDSNGSKILWAVCGGLDDNAGDGSPITALRAARTPNFDRLCRESETGMMRRRKPQESPHLDFAAIGGLSVLEVDGNNTPPLLEVGNGRVCQEAADDLLSIESLLAEKWEHFDLFVLKLDRHSFDENMGNDCNGVEWVELLDAWLPGVLARLKPGVFALSGEVWNGNGESADRSTPVLLHSEQSKASQTEGFNHRDCRRGSLGTNLSLSRWLLLLLAHAGRMEISG